MTFEKPKELKAEIVEIIDHANYLVYVERLDLTVHTTISGRLLMNFYQELYVGNELMIQISPIDNSKGRFFRDSLKVRKG